MASLPVRHDVGPIISPCEMWLVAMYSQTLPLGQRLFDLYSPLPIKYSLSIRVVDFCARDWLLDVGPTTSATPVFTFGALAWVVASMQVIVATLQSTAPLWLSFGPIPIYKAGPLCLRLITWAIPLRLLHLGSLNLDR
jgi:hypothetical protein